MENLRDETGVPLYSKYVSECKENDFSPHNSNYVGRIISSVFPGVKTKRLRCKYLLVNIWARQYLGLRPRMHDINLNDVSCVLHYLLQDMFVIERTTEHILIAYNTKFFCHRNRVLIELKMYNDLKVNISLGGIQHIDPAEYGICRILPQLSVHNVVGLLHCIKSLRLCTGREGTGWEKKPMIFHWQQEGETFERVSSHSQKCVRLIPLVSQVSLCSYCQKLSKMIPKKQIKKTSTTTQTSTDSTCDASVCTTSLQTAEDVLLNFFPHLRTHEKLVHLFSEQIKLAEIKNARGRRYEKGFMSTAFNLWSTSPRNYRKLIAYGFLLPTPKSMFAYKRKLIKEKQDIPKSTTPNADQNVSATGDNGSSSTFVCDEVMEDQSIQATSLTEPDNVIHDEAPPLCDTVMEDQSLSHSPNIDSGIGDQGISPISICEQAIHSKSPTSILEDTMEDPEIPPTAVCDRTIHAASSCAVAAEASVCDAETEDHANQPASGDEEPRTDQNISPTSNVAAVTGDHGYAYILLPWETHRRLGPKLCI